MLIAAVVFAESGLLVGFFLPGDTLLIGAGVVASQGRLPLLWLILAVTIAAIIGDNVGYSIGKRTGHRIFRKEEGILFHKEHIIRAEKFYERHGGKTIILARFIPMVRTFAPVVAGVGKMPRRTFMAYNVIGAVLWGAGVTLLGYWFGSKIPNLDFYIQWVILAVIVASFAFGLWHLLKEEQTRELIKKRAKKLLSRKKP